MSLGHDFGCSIKFPLFSLKTHILPIYTYIIIYVYYTRRKIIESDFYVCCSSVLQRVASNNILYIMTIRYYRENG